MSSSQPEPDTPMPAEAEAVLVTGVYGVGKSTVVAQLADLLEARAATPRRSTPDWLNWADAGFDSHADDRMLLANLASVVGNYRAHPLTLPPDRAVYSVKVAACHDVHPIRAVTSQRQDRSPRRTDARVFRTRGDER